MALVVVAVLVALAILVRAAFERRRERREDALFRSVVRRARERGRRDRRARLDVGAAS